MEFTETILINAPAAEVQHACLNLDTAQQWMKGLVRVERLDQGPLRAGSRWRETRRLYGQEASEVFELQSIEALRWSLFIDGSLGTTKRGAYYFDYTLTPQGTQTRLSIRARIEMGESWFVRIVSKLFLGTFRDAIRKDHEALKAYLERTAVAA